jgi:hypothetical protein
MLREIDLFGALAPSLLLYFLASVARLDAWLRGRPRAATRTSRFVQLMAA